MGGTSSPSSRIPFSQLSWIERRGDRSGGCRASPSETSTSASPSTPFTALVMVLAQASWVSGLLRTQASAEFGLAESARSKAAMRGPLAIQGLLAAVGRAFSRTIASMRASADPLRELAVMVRDRTR